MGEWCIDIIRFGRNAQLLMTWHRCDRTHVVQPVSNFYQYYPDVFDKGGKYFFKILSLFGRDIVKTIQFGKSVNNMTDLLTKFFPDIHNGHISILHHIV